MTKEDYIWVASKIQQTLEKSPYVLDFADYDNFDKPVLSYDKFIIYVVNEDKIVLGIQPGLETEKKNKLIEVMNKIVSQVEIKYL